MTLGGGQRSWAARLLRRAQEQRRPIGRLSLGYPGLDVEDAYAIQQANLACRLDDGAALAGHKIGLTSSAMQRLLGVDEPDYGYLLDTMLHADGVELARSAFCQPRVEPEIAFRLRTGLRGPDVDEGHALEATQAVAPALEVVDSRIRHWDIGLVDTIADNASSAAVVLGEWIPIDQAPPLSETSAELVVNGDVVDTGTGAAVLGHPARAIAWLANALARFGGALEPGEILMPGSFTSAAFVHAGDKVEARFARLGAVTVTFI